MPTWNHLAHYITSTLPPSEEGVLYHPQLLSKVHKLSLRQSFGEDVRNLLIYEDILELHSPSLNNVPNEVVLDLNVLGPVMKYWILREFDATLIITVNDCQVQLLIKYPCGHLVKPYGLTTR